MSSPLSWVIQISIKPGQRDTFTQLMHEMVADTKNNQPGTHTYEWFIGDDGATVHIYERYADSDAAMKLLGHFGQNYAERMRAISDVTGFTVYGYASDDVRAALEPFGASFLGTLGGFNR